MTACSMRKSSSRSLELGCRQSSGLQLGRRIAASLLVFATVAWSATETGPSNGLEQRAQEVRTLLDDRRAPEAKAPAHRLYDDTKNAFGAESVEAADALDLLVEVLYRGGEYRSPDTLALGEQAVALRERLHGSQPPGRGP